MVRFKNRYITVEVNPLGLTHDKPLKLEGTALYEAVKGAVQKLHGDFGVAAITSGFAAKYCNVKTRVALLRAKHGPHRLLASALPCVTKIKNHQVSLRTLHTSATLKQSYLFLQRYQRAALDRMWKNLSSDSERQRMEAAVLDLSALDTFSRKKEHHDKVSEGQNEVQSNVE